MCCFSHRVAVARGEPGLPRGSVLVPRRVGLVAVVVGLHDGAAIELRPLHVQARTEAAGGGGHRLRRELHGQQLGLHPVTFQRVHVEQHGFHGRPAQQRRRYVSPYAYGIRRNNC